MMKFYTNFVKPQCALDQPTDSWVFPNQNFPICSCSKTAGPGCFQGMSTLALELVHKTPVDEIPLAMCAFQGKILIGVGKLLRLYDLGKKKLLRKSENKVRDISIFFVEKFQKVENVSQMFFTNATQSAKSEQELPCRS